MPYACAVIVKLLVLVALAFSLGDTRAATNVPDQVSLLDVEPEAGVELLVIDHAIARALPRQILPLAELSVLFPRSLDEGGVFRPPRVLAA